MSDTCPGCQERRRRLKPEDRARIPLREACNAWREENDRLSEMVRAMGWHHPDVIAQNARVEAADDQLAEAARAFAASTPGGG